MIPDITVNTEISYEQRPSKTWRVDFENGRIDGMVDGLEAVAQAALFALQTQRYKYLTLSAQYGSELETLVGMDSDYIFSEGKRMIQDALSADTRITGTRDFAYRDGVLSFTLDTIFGSTTMDTGGILLENI